MYPLFMYKEKSRFCRSHDINLQNEYSTCNKRYERCKNIQKEIDPIDLISRKKKMKFKDDLNVLAFINSSHISFSHLMNLELDNITQNGNNTVNESNDKQFQDAEDLNEPVLAF